MNEPTSQTRRALGLRAYLNLALAVTIVIFALASAFTYTEVERRIRADVEERLDTLTGQVTRDTIGTWLGQKRSLAKALAAYPAMREMRVEEAQRIINATYAAAPADYNNIGFFDATGLMVADIAGGAGKGNLIKGNPWGQEVYSGRRIQSPELISSLNNRPIFVLYERVMDTSGAVVGVVGVGTDLTAIGDRLEEIKIGQTGEVVLVNSQGLVLNNLRHKPDSVLTLDLSRDPLTQLALSGQAGIVEMSDYRGVPVVAAYRFIPEYGWGIVVKQDADEAFAVLARLRAVFFGVIVGALAVALASNLIVQRRVSLALGRLIAGSQRFAAGELATPIEPLAIREFGHLAEEFNRMAADLAAKEAQLRGYAEQLEQKVRERTAQLEAANQGLENEMAERTRIEARLREAEVRYRSLFEQSPDGVVIVNPETAQAIEFNDTAHRQLGYSRDEFARLSTLDYEAAEEPEETAAHIEKIMRAGRDDFETRHRTKDGEVRNVLVTVQTIELSSRPYLYAVFRDITERKRAEAAIQKLNADLERWAADLEAANKELEAFSYSVSHDLRAPLRAVDGFSRILLEDYAAQLTPDAQRYLHLVRDNSRQMGRLVDDLLAFSRLGRQSVQAQTVAMTPLVRQALDELRAEQEGRQVEIIIGDLPECKADPALLRQVWINLLSNALKFTGKREAARVEIGCQRTDGEDVYFVKDNGVGFDMRYRDKLFGVFQRLHRAEEYEGTGVGLAIVQRIIHRHGGQVSVEAVVDKGAAFYFTLGGDNND